MDYGSFTALELGKIIKAGEVTSPELCEFFLSKNDEYNAFISKNKNALSEAEGIQKKIDGGELASPLAGVPIAVKDNICTDGIKTTCASKMLSDFVPPYDATVIKKLKNAGLLILGKTNMDEFAMGSTGETSYYGAALNPLDIKRAAGGSSSGSAAAVAGSLAPLALGSDTGGSVRMPASYCGVTGLKPTYGAVSRYGLIAYASSFDTIGTICKNAADTAALYNTISGRDIKDSTSIECKKLMLNSGRTHKGIKIGVMENVSDEAVKRFENLGAKVERFSFKLLEYAVPAYYIIACAQASSNLARYDGVRYGYRSEASATIGGLFKNSRTEGFGSEVKKRIMLGNFVLSAGYYDEYYVKALKVKNMINKEFVKLFEKYDYILAPVTDSAAPRLGESLDKPLKMYSSDVYNVLANLTGLPAVTVSAGNDKNGMPVGAQLIGKALSENGLLDIINAIEREEYGI